MAVVATVASSDGIMVAWFCRSGGGGAAGAVANVDCRRAGGPGSERRLAPALRRQSRVPHIRVWGETMGSQKCRIVGKSQSVLIMIIRSGGSNAGGAGAARRGGAWRCGSAAVSTSRAGMDATAPGAAVARRREPAPDPAATDAWYDGVKHQREFQIRELAWQGNLAALGQWGNAFDLKIGQQVLTWGTGDYVFLNDLFPKDYQSFFSGRDDVSV